MHFGRAAGRDVPVAHGNFPKIVAGDRIQLEVKARLSAALLPNVLIELIGPAECGIGTLSLIKDGNETGAAMRQRNARLQLTEGTIVVSQERSDVQAEPHLSVATPEGETTSSYDCLFQLVSTRGRTRLLCVSGTVQFAPNSLAPVPIEPGFIGEWRNDGSFTRTTADQDAESQSNVDNVLRAAANLKALRAARRNVFPP